MYRKLFKSSKAITLAVVALQLGACGSMQVAKKKPDYQPAMPIVIEKNIAVNGSIYHSTSNRFLFEDLKARRVGDLITVILEEQTNAAKTASTNTNKDSGIEVPGPTLLGLPITKNGRALLNSSVTSNTKFSGSGDSSQSNSLSGNITVTVSQVLPNGNMLVRGEKLLTLNNGSEVVQISGIVRAVDVTPQNTVVSNQIANANITYSGKGAVADSNKMGWVTRFFNSGLWPF